MLENLYLIYRHTFEPMLDSVLLTRHEIEIVIYDMFLLGCVSMGLYKLPVAPDTDGRCNLFGHYGVTKILIYVSKYDIIS